MSKTLKGTYLWNEVVNIPSQKFVIEFAQEVKTNYGITGITKLDMILYESHNAVILVYEFQNGDRYSVHCDRYGHVEQPTGNNYGWTHNGYRTITYTAEETVSDEFYAWFTENTIHIEDTIELTGTYSLHDTVLGPAGDKDWIEEDQDYVYNYDALPVGGLIFYENVNASIATPGQKLQSIRVAASYQGDSMFSRRRSPTYHVDVFYIDTDIGGPGVDSFRSYEGYSNQQGGVEYLGTWYGKGSRTITFNPGTTVSSMFYCWLVINAQNVELCELSGRWKWNGAPAHHTRDFDVVKLNFMSGFTNMEYMVINPDEQGSSSDVAYLSSKFRHKAYGDTADLSREWTNPAFEIVDFGDEAEKVTKEFYDWFTANATKQTLVEISGVWTFNSILNDETEEIANIYEPVSFNTYANNVAHTGMFISGGGEYGELSFYVNLNYCAYDRYSEAVEHDRVYHQDIDTSNWTHESTNKTVDFGDTPKLVSEEFYQWFTNHAVETLYEISGAWTFNEKLSEYTGEPITISGTRWFINTAERSRLTIDPHDLGDMLTIKYDDVPVFYDDAWAKNHYRTIHIGTSMRVPEPFYRWFMDNVERTYLLIEKATLADIGNAVRAKTGKNEDIKVSELANEISKIVTASNGIVSVSIREIE